MALFVGVMSGTSMDGIDCALVDLDRGPAVLVAGSSTPWPTTLQDGLQALAQGAPCRATDLARLDAEAGACVAEAVNALLAANAVEGHAVTAIGSHGQTVAHAPEAVPATTLQLADANVIAELTGITTISDFRRRDLAAGGEGAPLAPAFHAAMLRDSGEDRVVLNLGGIANITLLPADRALPVRGFDTGPANCLLDLWARQHLSRPYDEGGAWAAQARPDPGLLRRMLADPYFSRRPPKSTGTQYFDHSWLQGHLSQAGKLSPVQVQATLLALSGRSIAEALHQEAEPAGRILVCGGGVHNHALMQQLRDLLAIPVESTADYGIDPDWMEAMAFAWLAQQTLDGRPGNLPAVTGASGPRVLGAIHPAGVRALDGPQ